ncbi:aspartyl protease family protein [Sebaldella sp. S0638]|uniref:aspartyl protease family protein n=1 Tax=Sebaldella sp. S0638 TaxID=2957809 RepID=UPI0020A0A479|nr:aspartyl protease family protein [Sebaldella sp. S0638]MCP1224301.1 aspartyl protease family protein [Sebaldella sp. S0638]
MKKNILLRQIMSGFIFCIFITGITASSEIHASAVPLQVQQSENSGNIVSLNNPQILSPLEKIPTRQSIMTEIEELKTKLNKNPKDTDTQLAYARKLFQLGNFPESKKILDPVLKKEKFSDEALYLSAQIEYVTGNYKEAEKLYDKLNESSSKDYETKAQTGLLYIYYQTNQFDKAKNLTADLEKNMDEPLKEMMKGFQNNKPYKISWNGNSEIKIPFIANEPLPVVEMQINGKKINAIIDTGASDFYIDEETAAALNIHTLSVNTGKYAGGIEVETKFGMADSLSLNGVRIENIPVVIASINQFSALYDNIEISGIISTGILKQFLATMDYPDSRLILRPKNAQGKSLLQQYLAKQNKVYEIPFTLSAAHFMTAKGSINGKDSLNFFMDSGLADEKSGLILLEQTMAYTGIPMPKTTKGSSADGSGGLGGNDFEVGEFIVNKFRLGKLPAEYNVWSLYGILESSFNYEEPNGFIMDGLISHNFLKKYSWTINFDTMKMIFTQ